MLKKIIQKLRRKVGLKEKYPSETSKVRHLVIDYCLGFGCDIGFGGDKIKDKDCLGIDFASPYANTGNDKVDIACDVASESIPVANNTFDYVYSSHLIEDFEDTEKILSEFIRILKPEGNLILVFPDQSKYELYCRMTGQPLNTHHIHKNMGLEFMKNKLNMLNQINAEILFQSNCEIDYNVILVVKIYKKNHST